MTQNRDSVGDLGFGGEAPPLRGVQGGKAKVPLKLKGKGGKEKSPKSPKSASSTLTREDRDAEQIQNALGAFADKGGWAHKPVLTELQQQTISAIFVQRHYRQNMKRQLVMGRMTPMPRRSRAPGSARNTKSSRASGWGAKSRSSTASGRFSSRSVGGAPPPAPAAVEPGRSCFRRGSSRSGALSLVDDPPRSQQPAEPTTLGTSSRSPNVNLPSPRASPPTSSLPSPRAAARSREEDPALGGLPRSLPEGVPTRAFERSRRATPPVDSDRLSRQPSQAVGSSMVPEPSRQPTTTPEPVDGEEAASYTI